MNIKDAYIHNGDAILKDIKVENSALKKILAGKKADDTYLGWETVCDLTGIKPNAAGTADKVGHKLTFSGGVTGDWDGSADKTVAIPTKSSWNYDDVYLKLSGNGTTNPLTGTIYIKDVNGIILNSKDKDLNIWEVYGNSGVWASQYGFNLQYLGTSSGNNNDLVLWAHNQAGTHVETYRVKQDGTFIFKSAPKVGTSIMYHAGNLTIKTLMGTTAIGDSDEPVYWNGSSFVKAGAYPTKASWNYDDRYLKLVGGTMSNTNVVTNLNADLLDGYHASSFYQNKTLRSDQNSIYDLRFNYGQYDKGDFSGTYKDEYPTYYGSYIALTARDKNIGALMFFDTPTNNTLGHIYVKTRGAGDSNITYSEWGTIAYLTDNVASSSKWANARTITLTGSVTGSVSIDGSSNVTLATITNHTHTKSQITDFPTSLPASGGNADRAKFLETFKSSSTTNTYGEQYPIWAQWSDSANVRLKCTNYTVWTDKADNAVNADKLDNYHAGVTNGSVGIFVPWPNNTTLKNEGLMPSEYGTSEFGHPDNVYLQSICKWAIAHYTSLGSVTLIGAIAPNSSGTCILNLYSSSGKDSSTLLPRYCSGTYTALSGYIYNFGTVEYNWYYRQISAGYASSAGSATTSTYASNVGSSGTAGTNYVTASKVISACNWYDTMISSDSDTVINRWSEIVAFVAGFKETPDLATFLSNNYLAKAGGTMTGPLKWANATALPQQTSPQYFLCIDAFADGGTTKWASKADTLKALTGLTSTAIGDSDEPVYWNGSKFVKAGAYPTKSSWNYDDRYLKLSGGKITGPVTFEMSNDRKIYINNSDNETYWSLISFQQKGTEYGTLGTAGSTDLQWNGHNLYHAGNLTASVIGSLGTLSNNISGNAATATKATQDGNGNVITNTYLSLSGGTLTGTLGKSNNYIFKPNGGDFRTRTELYNGAICISFPTNIGNTMLSMWIDVYNYSTNKSFSVHVGGYTYNNSTFSNSPFAMVYGASHKVRLTYDNGFKIYIGETNSTWNYPQISIRDVVLGFGHNYSNWYNDWSVSFVTSFPTINSEITRYAITTDNISNQSVNYANSAGSVAWSNVTEKPATATRWPSWNEVTNKPSVFSASEYLNNYSISNPNSDAIKDNKVKWFAQINSSSGYAGNNYGFPVSNNANGILYLGTHPGKYGHQLGFSSNGNIYHRYQNGSDFPNTANGGSWEVLLTSNNYTTYTVKKDGTGASGTWGISITGNAKTATNVAWSGITDKPTFTTWSETSSVASYSLSNAAWTNTITLPTTAGSYILNIVSGSSTLTGVFSIGASDNAKDEISLHLHGNGPRLYARTNGTTLQLSSNDASATSRSVTIKYRRMI